MIRTRSRPTKLALALGLYLTLIGALVDMTSCSRNPPVQLTPSGQIAYHGDRVIKGIATLQDITINGESSGVVGLDDARTIMAATQIAGAAGTDLAKALRAGLSAEGAKAKAITIIRQALGDVPQRLSADTRKLIEPYLTVINTALAFLQ